MGQWLRPSFAPAVAQSSVSSNHSSYLRITVTRVPGDFYALF